MIAERLAVTPLVLQLPIGQEAEFAGVVDLLSMQALYWPPNDRGQPALERSAVPAIQQITAEAARRALVELAVEQDDAALTAYLDGQTVPEDVLRACIRKGTLAGAFVPVLAGAALKNKGIEPLLDVVVDYLPAPEDRPARAPVACSANARRPAGGAGTGPGGRHRGRGGPQAEHVGDVIGDLNRRRGQVRHQDQRGNAAVVQAMVPLQTLFGYIGSLRALTAGRASYTMQLDHYAVAPRHPAHG